MARPFPAPPRARSAPLAGPLLSLLAHAVVVLGASGGARRDARDGAGHDGRASGSAAVAPRAGSGGGERLRWIGVGDGTERTTAAGRPPVAYVVPGRGPSPAGRPDGDGAPSRAAEPTADGRDGTTPAPAAAARPAFRLDLPVPMPPLAEVTVVVAGVASSAPDLERRAARPDDFARPAAGAGEADPLVPVGLHAADGTRALRPIDVPPIALVSNPRPAYPVALAAAGVDGRVVVEFTIDSTGVIAPNSLHVVESTDARFTQAVHAVLPRLRFLPAQLGRQAIGLRVRQPFVFTMRGGVGRD